MRIAVVTGANRGLGLEVARKLASAGLRVIACSRTDQVKVTGLEPFPLDVTKDTDVCQLARHLTGGFDVLVNNAGISMDGFDASVAEKTLAVNFFGAMRVTDELLPHMRAGGRIVMVSSRMGELSCVSSALRAKFESPTLDRAALVALMESFVADVAAGVHTRSGWPSSAYRVSKVGLNALTRVLAREVAGDPRHILVNAACPGWVRTRMGGSGAPRSIEEGGKTPLMLAQLPEGGPSGGFFYDGRPTSF